MRPESIVFDSQKFTLLLGLKRDDLTSSFLSYAPRAHERGLQEKAEFHCTATGFQTAKKILELYTRTAAQNPSLVTDVGNAIEQLARGIDWSFTLGNDAYYLEKEYVNRRGKETRRSIIQMLEMPGMAEFYKYLNDALKQRFDVPPPHVTLYTGSTNPEMSGAGIGIDSLKTLQSLNPIKL